MFNNIPPVTKNLLLLNALFFAAKMFSSVWNLDTVLGAFYPGSVNFHPYQIITHMFMHGNLTHFFFNMYALYTFGAVIENVLGGQRFFTYYMVCGLGAFILFNFVNYLTISHLHDALVANNISLEGFAQYSKLSMNGDLIRPENIPTINTNTPLFVSYLKAYITPMVGASGAIFGLLIAFGMLYPDAKMFIIFLPIAIKAKYLMILYILFELFSGLRDAGGDNVAHFAHLGGALIGFIMIKYWRANQSF